MADGKIIIETDVDSNGLEKGVNKISSIAKGGFKMFTGAVVGASTALVAMGTASVKVGMDFEAQMSRVKAISGATNEEFKKLNAQALQLGADTSFSAKEAAEGMENLASAGFNTNEIMKAMPGLLDLAASSGEDLATSSDIAASTLRGFGLEADKAGHVADVLAKNAAATNAAVVDTGEAMKYIAPVANTVGWSLEMVTAAIGEMANAGIKGSQAGTTLRGAITRLAKPSDEAAKAMQKIGFNAYDSAGKMLPLDQIIGKLQKSTAGLTDKQKQQAIAQIFGQEAMSGMLVLINQGQGSLQNLANQYKNCDGAASEMAKTMKDNLKGSIEEFKGSAETLGITLYQSVNNPLKDVAKEGTQVMNSLTDAFKNGGLEGLSTGIGNAFAKIVTDIAQQAPKIISAGVTIIQAFITGIQNNLPAIAQGAIQIIQTLANGFITLLPQILQLGFQLLIQLAQGLIQALPNMIPAIIQLITQISDTIIQNLPTIIQLGLQLLLALAKGLADNLPTLIVEIPRIINSFADAFNSQLPLIIITGIKILVALGMGIIQAIPTLIANLPAVIMAIVNAITLFNWASLGKGLITKIGEGITFMKGNIGNIASGVAKWVETTIKNIFSGGLTWGKGLISSVGEGISGMGSYLASTARSIGSWAIEGIKGAFSSAVEIGKNLISGIWQGIVNMKDWILSKIGGFAGSIISSIKSAFDIHSPSRVMRDLIGKNIVAGIGVGIDIKTPDLKKDVNKNMSGLIKDMKATVDLETAKTTASVVAQNDYSIQQANPNIDTSNGLNKTVIELHSHVDVDGREVAYAIAPHQEILDEFNNGR